MHISGKSGNVRGSRILFDDRHIRKDVLFHVLRQCHSLSAQHIFRQQRDTPRASLAGVFHNRYRNTYRSSHDFLPRLRCLEQTAVAHQSIQLDGFSFGQQLHSYFKGCHSRIQLCAHKVSERQAAFRTAYQKRPSLLHVNDRLTRQIVAAQKAAAVFFSLRRFGI